MVIAERATYFHDFISILQLSYFCKIWTLCLCIMDHFWQNISFDYTWYSFWAEVFWFHTERYVYIYVYMSEHKQNEHNDGNRAQPLKRLLKTLFLAIKKSTGFTTDVIWVNTKVCSVNWAGNCLTRQVNCLNIDHTISQMFWLVFRSITFCRCKLTSLFFLFTIIK